MSDWLGLVVIYLLGAILIVVEIFVPAHGMLAVVGLAVLGYAVVQTFVLSQIAGLVALIALAILLPTLAIIAVKTWHRTFIGRRISPPNPVLTDEDRLPIESLQGLMGKTGRALTLLRPVGTCEFDGQRVECMSEYGMIDKDTEVEAVGLVDRTVSVRPVSRS